MNKLLLPVYLVSTVCHELIQYKVKKYFEVDYLYYYWREVCHQILDAALGRGCAGVGGLIAWWHSQTARGTGTRETLTLNAPPERNPQWVGPSLMQEVVSDNEGEVCLIKNNMSGDNGVIGGEIETSIAFVIDRVSEEGTSG
jgi:hypothetical protein